MITEKLACLLSYTKVKSRLSIISIKSTLRKTNENNNYLAICYFEDKISHKFLFKRYYNHNYLESIP